MIVIFCTGIEHGLCSSSTVDVVTFMNGVRPVLLRWLVAQLLPGEGETAGIQQDFRSSVWLCHGLCKIMQVLKLNLAIDR